MKMRQRFSKIIRFFKDDPERIAYGEAFLASLHLQARAIQKPLGFIAAFAWIYFALVIDPKLHPGFPELFYFRMGLTSAGVLVFIVSFFEKLRGKGLGLLYILVAFSFLSCSFFTGRLADDAVYMSGLQLLVIIMIVAPFLFRTIVTFYLISIVLFVAAVLMYKPELHTDAAAYSMNNLILSYAVGIVLSWVLDRFRFSMFFHQLKLRESKDATEHKLETCNTVLKSFKSVISEVLDGSQFDHSLKSLVPHMEKELFKKGEFIFHKGEIADKMFYVQQGKVRLVEIDKYLEEDNLIGETGIFSSEKKRTVSVVCEEDSEIYTMDKEKATELLYQNPPILFELIQLTIKRSLENLTSTVAEKERIEADLRIAHDIQQNMLPQIFPAFPDRAEFDIFALMEPAKEVGGDFYDFFFINQSKLCFLIGDVSGKGVPAALFMTIAKILLKREALRNLTPDEILYNVNNIICPDNETAMFVTILCAILDVETGELQFCNAGHNPPLIYHGGEDFEYMRLPRNFVLGPIEDTAFTAYRMELKPNDILFLYTDGVTEAMNRGGQLFSEDRLMRILSNLRNNSVTGLIHGVREEIEEFSQGAPQSDDITMITLQFFGKK
jgi:serine phosphatase RsbU (regulator of sigma subunit)